MDRISISFKGGTIISYEGDQIKVDAMIGTVLNSLAKNPELFQAMKIALMVELDKAAAKEAEARRAAAEKPVLNFECQVCHCNFAIEIRLSDVLSSRPVISCPTCASKDIKMIVHPPDKG
jgi:hypothetical protein